MAVIKCPECGHQTSEKATVCPSCGVEIAGKIAKCANCGEVFFKDDGFCPHCYRPYQFTENGEDNSPEPVSTTTDDSSSEVEVATTPDTTDSNSINSPAAKEDSHTYTTPLIVIKASTNVEKSDDSKIDEEEKENEETTDARTQNEEKAKPAEKETEEDDDTDDEVKFIDTDAEHLERPTKEKDDNEETEGKSPKRYIPFIVSIAITAIIAAVCLYFYNDSKSIRELNAFNSAMENGDVEQLNTFLRDFTDASAEHKQKIKDEIARLNKQEQDLSLVKVTRDKAQLEQYLKDYPNTPMKKSILATIDSLDWEDAYKTNTKAAYEKYIAEHANGIFIKEAKDKVTVKEVAATEEDQNMARSLFREFFLSVNGNDASRLTNTLNSEITSFMGTEKPGSGEVVGWMKRQHGETVSNVIWKLNHDYKISKREQNGSLSYVVEFTAKQTIIHKDGRSSSENYKITSNVSGKGKISSMSMTKYTPKSGDGGSSANVSKSKPSSGSSGTSSSSSASKPSSTNKQSSSNSSSTKTSSSSKPTASKSTSTKPKSSGTSSSSSKPSGAKSSPAKSGNSGKSSSSSSSSSKSGTNQNKK